MAYLAPPIMRLRGGYGDFLFYNLDSSYSRNASKNSFQEDTRRTTDEDP